MKLLEQIKPFKSIIILIYLFARMSDGKSQEKYFIMDEPHPRYDVKSYILKTEDLYAIKSKIEIVNIFPKYNIDVNNGREIILFSVLPDIVSNELWKRIEVSEIANNTITFNDLLARKQLSLYELFTGNYDEHNKFFNEYKLVVKRQGQYYVACNTLLQFFALRNRPEIFNSVWGTINTEQTLRTLKSVAKYYKNVNSYFPLMSFTNRYSTFDRLRDRKEFLSRKFKIGEFDAYQFWSLTDWHMPPHEYEVDRGIDRFIYIPEKGIVGGSFDFYFYYHRGILDLDINKFKDNMYSEKVMIAQDLERLTLRKKQNAD